MADVYIFLPGYPANTLNVMFEYKFLILFSKTTFHPNLSVFGHGIAIFSSLRFNVRAISDLYLVCI